MDILNDCELLTDEYIGLTSKISYYQTLFIEMEYMLEEVFEYYRKQKIEGKEASPEVQDKVIERASEVISEMLDDVSVVGAIIRYIDLQDDNWAFHQSEAALVFDTLRNLDSFIQDNAPEKLKQDYQYVYEFLEHTASKETLKWIEENKEK